MDIELIQICWADYVKIRNTANKLVGYPAYYTIDPDTGKCLIWPAPKEWIKIIVRVNAK